MKQDDLQSFLEGCTDIITERQRKEIEFYSDKRCPRCGSPCTAEADVQAMIRSGTSEHNYKCRCSGCGCLFDPVLGIIIELGNLGRLRPSIPIIDGED